MFDGIVSARFGLGSPVVQATVDRLHYGLLPEGVGEGHTCLRGFFLTGRSLWEGDFIEAIVTELYYRGVVSGWHLHNLPDLDLVLEAAAVIYPLNHRGFDLEFHCKLFQRRGCDNVPLDVCLPVFPHHSIMHRYNSSVVSGKGH